MEMLGHMLRMNQDAPAQNALLYAVEGAQKYKGRRGRHMTNLLDTLKADIKERGMHLRNTRDLELLRQTAADRSKWEKMARKKTDYSHIYIGINNVLYFCCRIQCNNNNNNNNT